MIGRFDVIAHCRSKSAFSLAKTSQPIFSADTKKPLPSETSEVAVKKEVYADLSLSRGCPSTTLNASTVVVGAVSKTTSTSSTTVITEEQGVGLGTAARPHQSAAVVVEAKSMPVACVHAMPELMDGSNSSPSVSCVYGEDGAAANAGPTRLSGASKDGQVGPITKQLTEIRIGSVAVIPKISELPPTLQARQLGACGMS